MARGKDKKKRKLEKKQEGEDVPKKVPHTLESLREKDETTVADADADADQQEEVQKDIELDELSSYYQNSYEPRVLITFSDNPHNKTRIFGKELTRIIPNSEYRYRRRSSVKKIVAACEREGVTDVVIVHEDRKQPSGFLLIHLPHGPTAHFRLTSCKITKELRTNYREITAHRPEVILNNFGTRVGVCVGRMLAALFHYEPHFRGRRAVTFHNQRDYIFFRHHRYEFAEREGAAAAGGGGGDAGGGGGAVRVRLRELGPRFTLRLVSLQAGVFAPQLAPFEWTLAAAGRRHALYASRRRFHL